MEVINPTSVKIPKELKKAAQLFAEKRESNLNRLINKALAKYIKFKPTVTS